MKQFQLPLIAALIISPVVVIAVLVVISMVSKGEPAWGRSITTGLIIGITNVLIQYWFSKQREKAKLRKSGNQDPSQ